MKIIAGIILYHPDVQRLQENIAAVKNQVDAIALWDNGGIIPEFQNDKIIYLTKDSHNIGIASALNGLCQYALDHGYDWILTLDQDSIVPSTLIGSYSKHLDNPEVAMLCPCIQDRNYGSMDYDIGSKNETDEVEACITSASMLRLSAWQEVGGFWDELFIDMVDFDLCWSLREKGFKIIRDNSQTLYHEIGHSKKVCLLGKENVIFNHSPIRCYYNARNTIAVGKKHHKTPKCNRWLIKRILLINLYEHERFKKNWMIFRGIKDGIRLSKSL